MKLPHQNWSTTSQHGSAVLIVLLLIAIVFLYLNVSVKSLHYLNAHLKLVEKHQVERLKATEPPTTTPQAP